MTRAIPPAGAYLHMLDRVDLLPQDWPGEGSLCVTPIWRDVDRATGTGYALLPEDRDLAERLQALILSGDAYVEATVRTDVDGRTYVSAEPRFAARTLRRDLAALGA